MLSTEVARRLEQKLGLGQFPLVRRRMYARLQRMAVTSGDGVLCVIANLLQEAEGPKIRDAGQYFCWVIKRRLEEAGYSWDGPPANESPAKAAAVKAELVNKVATSAAATGAGERYAQNVDEARQQLSAEIKRRAGDEAMRAELDRLHRQELVNRLREQSASKGGES